MFALKAAGLFLACWAMASAMLLAFFFAVWASISIILWQIQPVFFWPCLRIAAVVAFFLAAGPGFPAWAWPIRGR